MGFGQDGMGGLVRLRGNTGDGGASLFGRKIMGFVKKSVFRSIPFSTLTSQNGKLAACRSTLIFTTRIIFRRI